MVGVSREPCSLQTADCNAYSDWSIGIQESTDTLASIGQ